MPRMKKKTKKSFQVEYWTADFMEKRSKHPLNRHILDCNDSNNTSLVLCVSFLGFPTEKL